MTEKVGALPWREACDELAERVPETLAAADKAARNFLAAIHLAASGVWLSVLWLNVVGLN